MSYQIETTAEADETLARLGKPIRNAIIRRLLDFARNPGRGESMSAPGLFPKGQLFQFHFSIQGEQFWAGVIFRYSQDEQTLIFTHVFVESL